MFCATWYEIQTLEEINSSIYELYDITFMVRENQIVEEIISNLCTSDKN